MASYRIYNFTDEVDNDLLIEQVELRPGLYDKNYEGYSNTHVKRELWEEVCAVVLFGTWETLSTVQKHRAVIEVQKRWKNLRASFVRELRVQRQIKPDKYKNRRKTYVYYDKLLFLLSTSETQSIKCNDDVQEGSQNVQTDELIETVVETYVPQRINQVQKRKRSYKECLPAGVQAKTVDKTNLDVDQDTHFVLSLVPMLKRLPLSIKLDVQIQMLQIFKEASETTPHRSSIFIADMSSEGH